jgi:tRNA(Ile)-lysidine synthase
LRPLLRLRRAETCAACAALGLEPWDDPHNADARYQRVRLRREVLPLLDEVLQGGVAPALARTADLLRDDLDALDAAAAAALPTVIISDGASLDPFRDQVDQGQLDAARLAELPRAVRTRVLRNWLAAAGAGPLTAERTAVLDALLTDWHGQGPVDVPGGLAVLRRSGRLVVLPSPRAQPQVPPGES